MEESAFTISTPNFEGPLSLLLELVQKRKVFISDIALADIADEFIQVVKAENRTLAEDARFVSVAATLLLIKSKSLLPHFELSVEEEESAEELRERLIAFAALRKRGKLVEKLFAKNILMSRKVPRDEVEIFVPEKATTPNLLHERILFVRAHLPARELPERVSVKQTLRLEDVLANLSLRIKKYVALSFKEFAQIGKAPKRDVVVHFIALLELVKQGFLEAHQKEPGGDIELKRQSITVPNYS